MDRIADGTAPGCYRTPGLLLSSNKWSLQWSPSAALSITIHRAHETSGQKVTRKKLRWVGVVSANKLSGKYEYRHGTTFQSDDSAISSNIFIVYIKLT